MLLQEVVDDSIVPSSTSDSLARASGMILLDPIRPIRGLKTAESPSTGGGPGGATAALPQNDRVNGDGYATHGELMFSAEARAQHVRFFATGLENGHATIEPAYP
jgi:hypothetical protein